MIRLKCKKNLEDDYHIVRKEKVGRNQNRIDLFLRIYDLNDFHFCNRLKYKSLKK